jgi:hypothetical protein
MESACFIDRGVGLVSVEPQFKFYSCYKAAYIIPLILVQFISIRAIKQASIYKM